MAGDAFRRSALQAIKTRDGWDKNSAVGVKWSAPDCSFLESAEPEAPQFPIEVLGRAGEYVASAARGANAPADYVAAMLLASVGAIVGKKVHVRINDDWLEPVAPWCVIVGFPSTGKTPACKPLRKKLRELETVRGVEHVERLQRQVEEAEAREASVEELTALRAELSSPPRLLVNDTTSEALARVEMRASDGLLVERDELAGLIEGLERYGAGGDRAFYLEAYDSGAFTIDRVKAGTLQIDNHCFSVFGGIQPDRFRSLLTHSGEDDGFAARLLIFWPKPSRPTSVPNGADHSQMTAALTRLDSVSKTSPKEPLDLWLATEAFDVFDAWYGSAYSERIGLGGKAGSAFGKLAGMAARLAGCLHLLDFAFKEDEELALPTKISATIMSSALDLVELYFVKQIQRAYHGTDTPSEERIASDLLRHCRVNGLRSFNIRQARREWGIAGAARTGAAREFGAAARVLVDAGWARALQSQSRAKDFEVNPALFESDMAKSPASART